MVMLDFAMARQVGGDGGKRTTASRRGILDSNLEERYPNISAPVRWTIAAFHCQISGIFIP